MLWLNLSNEQITTELDVAADTVQGMATHLREGVVVKKPTCLSGEIDADEVYVVAGHKGHPEIAAPLGREGRRRRLKGKRGRGTLAKKNADLGLVATARGRRNLNVAECATGDD